MSLDTRTDYLEEARTKVQAAQETDDITEQDVRWLASIGVTIGEARRDLLDATFHTDEIVAPKDNSIFNKIGNLVADAVSEAVDLFTPSK